MALVSSDGLRDAGGDRGGLGNFESSGGDREVGVFGTEGNFRGMLGEMLSSLGEWIGLVFVEEGELWERVGVALHSFSSSRLDGTLGGMEDLDLGETINRFST